MAAGSLSDCAAGAAGGGFDVSSAIVWILLIGSWRFDARQGVVVEKARKTGKAVRVEDFCLAISAGRGC